MVADIKELYEWKKELGVGQFGVVHKAVNKKLGTKCAMKVIHKKKVEKQDPMFAQLMR